MRLDALCCTFRVWDFVAGCWCFLWGVVSLPFEMSCILLHNLLMRCHAFGTAAGFAYESSCFVLLMRFPYELSCFLTPRRVACEMSCFLAGKVILLWGFLYESSSLFAVIRFACEMSCFLAAYFSYVISWFWAVTTCPSEMSCFLSLTRFHEIILWEFMILRWFLRCPCEKLLLFAA